MADRTFTLIAYGVATIFSAVCTFTFIHLWRTAWLGWGLFPVTAIALVAFNAYAYFLAYAFVDTRRHIAWLNSRSKGDPTP